MNRKIIVLEIIVLFIKAGLSGCNEQESTISEPVIDYFTVTPHQIESGIMQ